MSLGSYYFALQYSAIQKTVLRHDRLWSIAGMSQLLATLNEITLPAIVREKQGDILVAGGGKFTAKFDQEISAEDARREIVQTLAKSLPMLEFQASEIVYAGSLQEAKNAGLLEGINAQKRRFRGYGVSFNPHFKICPECGEYPVVTKIRRREGVVPCCRICRAAFESGFNPLGLLGSKKESLTSIEHVYRLYLETAGADNSQDIRVPRDFEKFFSSPENNSDSESRENFEHKRMAVWFSDMNNMNAKVPVWLAQPDEHIPRIFQMLTDSNIEAVAKALSEVFPLKTWIPDNRLIYLPFRIIVAGGDDLCVVFPEEYVLGFARALSKAVKTQASAYKDNRRELSVEWLKENADTRRGDPGSYSFGSSFVIASYHTPFKAIHELGENLMSSAKNETERIANGINWRVMGVDEDVVADTVLDFEKPIFIDPEGAGDLRNTLKERLTLTDYIRLRRDYTNKDNRLSGSQIQKIVSLLIRHRGKPDLLEREMIQWAASSKEKGVQYVLADPELRRASSPDAPLDPARMATLFELINISDSGDERRSDK